MCTTHTPDRHNIVYRYPAAHTKHSRKKREGARVSTRVHAGCESHRIDRGLAAAEFGAHAPSEHQEVVNRTELIEFGLAAAEFGAHAPSEHQEVARAAQLNQR